MWSLKILKKLKYYIFKRAKIFLFRKKDFISKSLIGGKSGILAGLMNIEWIFNIQSYQESLSHIEEEKFGQMLSGVFMSILGFVF